MEKTAVVRKRALARRLATELTLDELRQITGHGTSFQGSYCDDSGRAFDLTAVDCTQGGDSMKCV